MCTDVTSPLDGSSGALLDLCDDAALCLLVRLDLALPEEIAHLRMDREFFSPSDPGDMSWKIPREWKPGFHLLAAFCDSAKTAVFEYNYFDMDYRSELALMQETSFAPISSRVTRLHFFSSDVEDAATIRLVDFVSFASNIALDRERVVSESGETVSQDKERDSTVSPQTTASGTEQSAANDRTTPAYLGYTVLRPRLTNRFGRSVVTPNAAIRNDRNKIVIKADTVRDQVRTAVIEPVNLFGVYLLAVGTPFMQQDGNLLRCAHVSAWTCHYTAVLRSAVARRPTGHFHQVSDARSVTGRQYPSGGVTKSEVISILQSSDMPPEAHNKDTLRRSRQTGWADRAKMAQKADKIEHGFRVARSRNEHLDSDETKKLVAESDEFWTRENLSASICRYLNSGIPVILVRLQRAHTQVVVGYLRHSDLADTELVAPNQDHTNSDRSRGSLSGSETTVAPATDATSGSGSASGEHLVNPAKVTSTEHNSESSTDVPTTEITHFIISDDGDGPYYVVSLDNLVREVRASTTDVLVPLPRSLWMPGDTAERLGTRMISQYTKQRQELVEEWSSKVGADVSRSRDAINGFADSISHRGFTVRTYATTGVDLKESVRKRLAHDPELVRHLSMMQLPRYVWVVEAIHRVDRADRKEANVHAMIVLDASDVSTVNLNSKPPIRSKPPLFAHLPGQMLVTPYAIEQDTVETSHEARSIEEHWLPASSDAYVTGRWNHGMLAEQSPLRAMNHARGAAVGRTSTS